MQQGVIHILIKGGMIFICFRLFSAAISTAGLLAKSPSDNLFQEFAAQVDQTQLQYTVLAMLSSAK